MSTPPKRPEKPSAVPPPAPRDSDKAPDEIIALGPQKENCTRLHFPLSSNARAQLKHSGRGKGTQRLHPVPATERAEAERDSGLLSSSACSLQLSLFLGRGLEESGSRFTSSQVSWGHRSQWPCSVGPENV